MSKHIFKRKEQKFTQVTNNLIEDTSLSWKAKGIYLAIQRYITISDWEFSMDHLISLSTDGKKSFNSGWKELKDRGYLKQYRIPNKDNKGSFDYYYELLDEPNTETPALVNLRADGSVSNGEFKQENNKESICTKKHIYQKGVYAKRGVYTNTDITNTDITNTNISSSSIDNNNIILINKNDDDDKMINDIYNFIKDNNLNIKRNTIKNLLVVYKLSDIMKAITMCIGREDIKSPTAYLKTVLKDITTNKTIVNNINVNNSQKANNTTSNYTSNNSKRNNKSTTVISRDYISQEQELLSWYNN